MKKLFATLAMMTVIPMAAFGSVIQSTVPASSDSYWYGNGWAWQNLGNVTLATGTNNIVNLTSSANIVDQGWGGQDPSNGILVSLYNGSTNLYNIRVAGSTHYWSYQAFSISAVQLSDLNAALSSIDWTSAPIVTLQMNATPWAYPGWELHTRDASFTVTSEAVPEPASMALFGLGLGILAFSRRKFSK